MYSTFLITVSVYETSGAKAHQKTGIKGYLKNWYQGSPEILVPRLFRKLIPRLI
jgi:hypothetical protein